MEADFWHEGWERGELGWHLDDVNPLLVRYWDQLGLLPGVAVLVPLCGKSRDLHWLAQRGHPVLGVELSQVGVESFFKDAGLTPQISDEPPFLRYRAGCLEILCGDIFGLSPGAVAGVGAVYDRGALVALKPGLRDQYVALLRRVLDAPKPTLLVSFDYPQQEMDGPPFAVNHGEIERLFGTRYAMRKLATLDVLPDHPRFRERGVTRLHELVVALNPRDAS